MSEVGTADATVSARKLAGTPAPVADPVSVEMVRRRAVVALRRAEEAHGEVASAFEALLKAGTDAGVDLGVESGDPSGDDEAVLDAVRSLDRARADLLRLVCATAGRAVVAELAPLLEVSRAHPVGADPRDVAATEGLVRVVDDEFGMTVPIDLAADEVALSTVFVERKRAAREATGGDFGPDAADPRHYARCPADSSGSPEDCTCLSSGGSGRPPRMALAADGLRLVIEDSDRLVVEAVRGGNVTPGGMHPEYWAQRHGELRELFEPGSAQPPASVVDRVWILAERDQDPEVEPFERAPRDRPGWRWVRGGSAYPWAHLNTVALVSDVIVRPS